MKNYQRILIAVTSAVQSDILLERAVEVVRDRRAQIMVLRILDTAGSFEPDGPAASLPREAAARRAPEAKRQVELQLARKNLGWAEAQVVWGDPPSLLAAMVHSWNPDLVVACTGGLAQGVADNADALMVDCGGILKRFSGLLFHPELRHA